MLIYFFDVRRLIQLKLNCSHFKAILMISYFKRRKSSNTFRALDNTGIHLLVVSTCCDLVIIYCLVSGSDIILVYQCILMMDCL